MISAAWSCEIFTSEIFLEGCCLKECGWSSGNFSNPNSRVYYDVIFLIIDISNTLPDFIGFSPIFHSNAHTWPHFLRCERNFSVILTRWHLFAVRRSSKLVKRWWINYRNNCAEKFAQTILSVSRYYRVLMVCEYHKNIGRYVVLSDNFIFRSSGQRRSENFFAKMNFVDFDNFVKLSR